MSEAISETETLKEKPIWIDNKRYVIQYGKFGVFFYDIESEKPMSLDLVCELLNKYCLFAEVKE